MTNFLLLEVNNLTILLSEIPRKINSKSAAFHVEKRRNSAPYAKENVVPCEVRRLSGCERDINSNLDQMKILLDCMFIYI